MNTRTHLVCAFVEPQKIGERFAVTYWPLHVTIVPWFKLESSSAVFTHSLKEAIQHHEPFVVKVGSQSRTRFVTKRVSLLEPSQWQPLHETVLNLVTQQAQVMATKLFIGPYYRPHVTFQRSGHLNPGDQFRCDSLYIVQRQGKYREVVGKVELGNEKTT